MKSMLRPSTFALLAFWCNFVAIGKESNGLAPEVTALNAKDVSYQLEAQLPDLDQPYISVTPADKKDGLIVGRLGVDGGDIETVQKYASELANARNDEKAGNVDSMLIGYRGKLIFESYYRRGRANYPHYQMSITKSYTALALGRAIQLGLVKLEDVDKPAISFLKKLDTAKLVPGVDAITIAQAMQMSSGIRLDDGKAKDLQKNPEQLKGQGEIQAYLQYSAAIPPVPRQFKYQESDPAIAMQVLNVVAPGGAEEFIRNELLKPMGITNYHWETAVSDLPKSAAGSSLCSRDMLKFGMLILGKGKWQGQQLIPEAYITRAIAPGQANANYGFFLWVDDFKVGDKSYHCVEGRGAGGQFIFMFPELDLVTVVTSHDKGMGNMLTTLPQRIIPAFAGNTVREILVEHSYLHLPVKTGAPEHRMKLVVDGKTVREFAIELADGKPDFQVFSDVSAFKGRKLGMELDQVSQSTILDRIVQADDVPGVGELYREKYRPQFHFSPRRGWVGDPNGLVYYKGEYHLFFQYNPYETKWGNMAWGHAVSKDLVRWQELPITLYPPKYGDHPYSGSAVVDKENSAGFKKGTEDPIVIIFPSTRRGICLAFSNDGGRTFAEYEGNPLQGKLGGDPRVFWHESTRRWIMITCRVIKTSPEVPAGKPGWLANAECGFDFYSSSDLKHWERNGTVTDCWECPDLFELPVNGDRSNAKWVLMPNHVPSLSGGGKYAGGRYFVGTFDGRQFTPDSERLQFNHGNAYGAAQSYNDIPAADGRRINVGCAFGSRMPGMPFGQMMNFPAELTLRTTADGLRLFAWPIKEIESLYVTTRKMENIVLVPEGTVLPGVEGDLFDISAEFVIGEQAEEVGLKIRGVPVTFNARTNQLICDNRVAPLKPVDGRIRLRILVDRVSFEIFANDGRVYMPMAVVPKDDELAIAVFGKGAGAKLTVMTVSNLKSVWEP